MSESNAAKPFEWPIRVYYEDTDLQGVVYYANYFRYMERARTEWLRSLGVEQDKLLEQERRYFVVVDTYAEFLKPARFTSSIERRLSGWMLASSRCRPRDVKASSTTSRRPSDIRPVPAWGRKP